MWIRLRKRWRGNSRHGNNCGICAPAPTIGAQAIARLSSGRGKSSYNKKIFYLSRIPFVSLYVKRHRNTPKRIYIPGSTYAITTVTGNRYPYFNDDILSEFLIRQMRLCTILHDVTFYGYKINPDHVHAVIKPEGKSNYSKIVFSLKKQFSHNANIILGYNPVPSSIGAQAIARLSKTGHESILLNHNNEIQLCRERFILKYGNVRVLPRFKWQQSYYLHRITDDNDLYNQLRYIEKQWSRHNLEENKWCYITRPR